MDCHHIIEDLVNGRPLDQATLRNICDKVIEVLVNQSNVLQLTGRVNIVGDVHGQFYDVLKLMHVGGAPPHQQYLFLGDYVDRGYHSLQTFILLATYKVMHPERVHLLRGNHQSRQISSMYGFYEECQKKYGSSSVWKLCNQVFDYLPLAALVNNDIFCLHGGLSPQIHTLDEINDIDRVAEIPTSGGFGDLVWSDPDEIQGWMMGSRGVGWLFGSRPTNEFNHHNWLRLIVRSHQLVQSGYQTWFKGRNLVTVWSAPNYCYRCGNQAVIMQVEEGKGDSPIYQSFSADPRSQQSVHYRQLMPYFL